MNDVYRIENLFTRDSGGIYCTRSKLYLNVIKLRKVYEHIIIYIHEGNENNSKHSKFRLLFDVLR